MTPRRYLLPISVIATVILSFSIGYLLGKSSRERFPTEEEQDLSSKTTEDKVKVEIVRPNESVPLSPSPLTSPQASQVYEGSSVTASPEGLLRAEGTLAPKEQEPLTTARSQKGSSPSPQGNRHQLRFTVQVGSFQDRDSAERLALELESQGYDAYVEKAMIPQRGVWYRVRVGSFATKEEARAWAEQNLEKMGRKGYPTTRSFP